MSDFNSRHSQRRINPENPQHQVANNDALTFVIGIDDQNVTMQPIGLMDANVREQLISRIQSATQVNFAAWETLAALPDESRSILLQLAKLAGRKASFTSSHGHVFRDPLEGLFCQRLCSIDLQEVGRTTRFAVEVAGLFFPGTPRAAAERIKRWLESQSIVSERLDTLASQIRAISQDAELADEKLAPTDVAEVVLQEFQAPRLERGEEVNTPPLRYFQNDIFRWDGKRWSREIPASFRAETVRIIQRQCPQVFLSDPFVKSVLTNIQAKTLLKGWNESPPFFVVNEEPLQVDRRQMLTVGNGVIDVAALQQGNASPEFFAHDARFFSTTLIPYDYNPQAQCPLWLQTLSEIFPRQHDDDRRQEVLQEYLGYSLLPHDNTHEVFLILVGAGANGKSTVLRVIEKVLGKENVSNVPLEAIQGEFRLFQMADKLANISFDMQRLDRVEEGKLKTLTSGEPMQVNRKNRDPVTMRPTAKLFIATNELPPFNDRSDGIWRRMIVLPFQEQFFADRRDPNRAENLYLELPGILNWALAGAIRLHQQGGFTDCAVCLQERDQHRHHSDPFRQFVDECVRQEPDLVIPKAAMYDAYVVYCEDNGRKSRNAADFGKQLLSLPGVDRRREGSGARTYLYTGIGLTEHADVTRRTRRNASDRPRPRR